MNNLLLCPDSTPGFLRFFDLSIAPPLLFYAYIPIIAVSLLLGVLVLKNDRVSSYSRLFFILSTVFILLLLNEILQWVAVYANVVQFGWQLVPLFRTLVCIFTVYFVYNFIYGADLAFRQKLLLSGIYLGVLLATPTSLNITGFDLTNCEGIPGVLWDIVHGFELLSVLWIIILAYHRYRQVKTKGEQVLLIAVSSVLFLTVFFVASVYGDITSVYQVGLIGPIGMLIFLGVLVYMMVRFRTFNVKLMGAQALVFTLTFLIGSQLFFIKSQTNFFLTGLTLSLSVLFGGFLIRGVKREVEQRERIQALAEHLEIANKGQENLIHIMNHQIKGYLAIARNIFAEMIEGTYGAITPQSKNILSQGLDKMRDGVDYVQTILKGASAQSGSLPYDMKYLDLEALYTDLITAQKPIAEKAGLTFESEKNPGNYQINGDPTLLEESFKNLITNAIKYNVPHGSIKVILSNTGQKILFAVRDTGRGISPEDAGRLFKPGGMGKDSLKYNVEASGFGLAFVKPVVEKHNGRVWFESNTPNPGSTFFVELPVGNTVSK